MDRPHADHDLGDARHPALVHVLGGFDPYVLAPISHRAAIVPEGHIDDVSRTAGWISAMVLVDGFVAGTWTAQETADGTIVQIDPFAPLTPDITAALSDRAADLGVRGLLTPPVAVRVLDRTG